MTIHSIGVHTQPAIDTNLIFYPSSCVLCVQSIISVHTIASNTTVYYFFHSYVFRSISNIIICSLQKFKIKVKYYYLLDFSNIKNIYYNNIVVFLYTVTLQHIPKVKCCNSKWNGAFLQFLHHLENRTL